MSHEGRNRRTRTYYGLHFKLHVSGHAKRFSWNQLISEIVVKAGLLGVVSTVLDLLWQLVFPLLGFPDYNHLVFKSVKQCQPNQSCDGNNDDSQEAENNVKTQ